MTYHSFYDMTKKIIHLTPSQYCRKHIRSPSNTLVTALVAVNFLALVDITLYILLLKDITSGRSKI